MTTSQQYAEHTLHDKKKLFNVYWSEDIPMHFAIIFTG